MANIINILFYEDKKIGRWKYALLITRARLIDKLLSLYNLGEAGIGRAFLFTVDYTHLFSTFWIQPGKS